MLGPAIETVGEGFQVDLLKSARDKTLDIVLRAAAKVVPGMSEAEAKAILVAIQITSGAPTSWHPPQIRFGENTVLPFGVPGNPEVRLQESDIFFFDIGPIFDGHEGDVGRPFVVGGNAEHIRCCADAQAIWCAVQKHWLENAVTGADLYHFANTQAEQRGWRLSLQKANGHRIADFPHVAKGRGSIEGYTKTPEANRWILEVQIRHPEKPFGAFFEDLLN